MSSTNFVEFDEACLEECRKAWVFSLVRRFLQHPPPLDFLRSAFSFVEILLPSLTWLGVFSFFCFPWKVRWGASSYALECQLSIAHLKDSTDPSLGSVCWLTIWTLESWLCFLYSFLTRYPLHIDKHPFFFEQGNFPRSIILMIQDSRLVATLVLVYSNLPRPQLYAP